jgi:hypothetical protein
MTTSSDRLTDNAIALAWSLWTELGVSGWQRSHTSHAIDPEQLILFTAWLGDADPRLRDEATDWCISYGRYVSVARLKSLLPLQTPEAQAAFADTAAMVNSDSGLRWPGAAQARPYQRTRRSAVADFSSPSLVVLRLRALFGVGARAEVVRAFLADPEARLSAADAATGAGYTKRNMAEALDALRMAGLLEAHALRNQRIYSLAATGWLSALPGGLPDFYPPWDSVFRILERLQATQRGAGPLAPRARNVEAADALYDLRSDLRRVGVRLSDEQQSVDAWPTLEGLATELSEAWTSGAFASADGSYPP